MRVLMRRCVAWRNTAILSLAVDEMLGAQLGRMQEGPDTGASPLLKLQDEVLDLSPPFTRSFFPSFLSFGGKFARSFGTRFFRV
jgi:hypothetical protein